MATSTTAHNMARLKCALKHVNTFVEFRNSIIWSDESGICLYGHDGRMRRWLKPEERFSDKAKTSTKKFGAGGIMVWGCISECCIANITFIRGEFKYGGLY